MSEERLKVVVWGENVHERENEVVRGIYPDGMHETIASGLRELDSGLEVSTATLQEKDCGLPEERLAETDVLLWWGHRAHREVPDDVVDRVQKRVLEGMGLLVLHSGHYSKIFKRLMGTTCSLVWREAGETERVWVCNPGHPIVQGLDKYFEVEQSEMYGEPFGIPSPDEQVFVSWYEGGEVFRSGCCWRRGNGKIFYFSPGHETYPIYYDKNVRRVLANGVRWAAPAGSIWKDGAPNVPIDQAPEKIERKGPSLHADGEEGFK